MQKIRAAHARARAGSFEIIPARYDDMPLVADFVRSSADWYRSIVDEKDMGEHAVDDNWAAVNYRRRDFYIGYDGAEPVGTISLQYLGLYAYLGYVYLDVRHVGKGYGQRLLRFAERTSRARGMRAMALIGHPKASWAKRAYLKYGFKVIETQKERVLCWQNGALRPYYEENFELYVYTFNDLQTCQNSRTELAASAT